MCLLLFALFFADKFQEIVRKRYIIFCLKTLFTKIVVGLLTLVSFTYSPFFDILKLDILAFTIP